MNMLAVNVAMLRKRTGLNVKQLADMMGVGETTVRNRVYRASAGAHS